MSYDLDLYFRSPEFPDKEWTEILSWFDAIERTVELDDLERYHGLRKEWSRYGVFYTLYERHTRLSFADDQAYWKVSMSTGSGA